MAGESIFRNRELKPLEIFPGRVRGVSGPGGGAGLLGKWEWGWAEKAGWLVGVESRGRVPKGMRKRCE